MSDYHNHQKKIALINDMTGFGRCSIAVALPVISMLRVQCCALPTAIFSNHTGFESFYYQDYTDHMQPSTTNGRSLALNSPVSAPVSSDLPDRLPSYPTLSVILSGRTIWSSSIRLWATTANHIRPTQRKCAIT